MDWIYLILIIAFFIWSVQIIMVYRRQSANIELQIDATRNSQQDVVVQAEDYEARALDLTEQLSDLKTEADALGKTEKGLEQEVNQYRQQNASRRPTRHRVQLDGDAEG